MNLQTVSALFIVCIVLAVICILAYLGALKWKSKKKHGEFIAPEVPITWLVSIPYGIQKVEGIRNDGGITRTKLTGYEMPVTDIILDGPNQNTILLTKEASLTGDEPVYLHIPEEFINERLENAFHLTEIRDLKKRIAELVIETERLREQNRDLMTLRMDYLDKELGSVKKMKEAFMVHKPGEKRGGGVD